MSGGAFVTGEKVDLRPLTRGDVGERYLGWLNDPEILRFRGPKAFVTTLQDVERYVDGVEGGERLLLAIIERATQQHIGNIALANILWVHGSAELNIMVGERSVHGKGLGRDAIRALSSHAFRCMGFRRVWSESPNPAFNAAVAALGWKREGEKREAFLLDGKYVPVTCWALLKSDAAAAL